MNAIINSDSFVKDQAGICIWFVGGNENNGVVYEANNDGKKETVSQMRGAFPDVFYSGFNNFREMSIVANLLRKYYSGYDNVKEEMTPMEQTALTNWMAKLKKTYPAREAKKVYMVQHANGVCEKIMKEYPPVPPEGILQIPVPKSWLDKNYAIELREKGIPCTSVEQFRKNAWDIWGDRKLFGRSVSLPPVDHKPGDMRCKLDIILDEIVEKYCPDYIKKPDTILELSTKQMLKLGELDDVMRSVMIDQIKNSDCPEF